MGGWEVYWAPVERLASIQVASTVCRREMNQAGPTQKRCGRLWLAEEMRRGVIHLHAPKPNPDSNKWS